MNWVEVKVTDEILERAQVMADRMGAIKNSIRKGQGNLAGFIGELIVEYYIGDVQLHSTKDHDMWLFPLSNDPLSVDVKTKQRTVKPRGEYTCHIAATSEHQRCDIYIFCQVNLKPKLRAWILGWMTKKDFMKKSVALKKGQSLKDVGYNNDDFKQKADGNVLLISDLRDIKDIP